MHVEMYYFSVSELCGRASCADLKRKEKKNLLSIYMPILTIQDEWLTDDSVLPASGACIRKTVLTKVIAAVLKGNCLFIILMVYLHSCNTHVVNLHEG